MALTEEEVKRRYPIHWRVWNNEHEELNSLLSAKKFSKENLEAKDPQGRTPLLLAVTLNHIECVQVLIDAGADVNCEKDGWTAVHEATATGDLCLLSLVLRTRDGRRAAARARGVPTLLNKLSLAPDFYVEMKWEFTSWVPLVSRMCPFDTYRVYKRGGNVRVDTTLVGFDNNRWQRGDRTYIFRPHGNTASLTELDHEVGSMWCEVLEDVEESAWPPPPRHALEQRLRAPIAINYLDTDKISFERNKSGIWGWRQDKSEPVNGYECKVFSANNVELVSKTRTEHLPKGERARHSTRAPFAGLLALADRDTEPNSPTSPLLTPDKDDSRRSSREELCPSPTPSAAPAVVVSWQQYFSGSPLPADADVGRPKEVSTKLQKFRATLWLCDTYPLELQEQLMPILDLMASMSSPHFAKLKDFIQMQLPAGFPVKIEIPLFHVLNARITFGNIFATETPVPHVQCIHEGDRMSCVLDDEIFTVGKGYRDAMTGGAAAMAARADGEEGLLQYAIEQSLMDPGTHADQVDVWEALRGASPGGGVVGGGGGAGGGARCSPTALLQHEEAQLQRAIEASLASLSLSAPQPVELGDQCERVEHSDVDAELLAALEMSAREHARQQDELLAEQRAIDDALRLSMLDH